MIVIIKRVQVIWHFSYLVPTIVCKWKNCTSTFTSNESLQDHVSVIHVEPTKERWVYVYSICTGMLFVMSSKLAYLVSKRTSLKFGMYLSNQVNWPLTNWPPAWGLAGVEINFFNNLPVGQVITNVYLPGKIFKLPETKRRNAFWCCFV